MTTYERACAHAQERGYPSIGYAATLDDGRVVIGAHRGNYGERGCVYLVAIMRGDSFRVVSRPLTYGHYNKVIVREVQS